jgi:hypothetical protein
MLVTRRSSCLELVSAHEVRLVEDKDVGERNLLLALARVIEVQVHVLCVDEGHDAVQREELAKVVVDEERLRHGTWVGHARGFDQNVVELVLPLHQVTEDADEVASDGAADAPVVHLEYFFVGIDNQRLIDSDLSKLVLDDGNALAMVLREDSVQERGLP